MKAQMQKGFTLIELMIVVAIIGILAAIALPAYQDYTGRAQASEALTLTAGVRADIAVQLSETGSASGISVSGLRGKYVSNVVFSNSATGGGVTGPQLSASFDSGVHSGKGPMTITADVDTSTGQIKKWVCDGLDDKYLPSGCRQ